MINADDSNTTRHVPNREKSLREVVPNFSEDHRGAIALAAYFRAERRGFDPGRELEYWLAGEAEIREQLISNGQQL